MKKVAKTTKVRASKLKHIPSYLDVETFSELFFLYEDFLQYNRK